jgi:hypothetical protein
MKAYDQISSIFCISVFLHNAHVILHLSWYELPYGRWCELTQAMACMVMSLNPQPDVMGHSIHLCLHPSPPMPPVSLEQLLASQNAIIQRLAKIDERQARQSQQHQQP